MENCKKESILQEFQNYFKHIKILSLFGPKEKHWGIYSIEKV
jgi:hypothetical protein